MRSILVEIIRSGAPESSLNSGRPYLVSVAGGREVRDWVCTVGPSEFGKAVKCLRYRGESSADLEQAKSKLAGVVTELLGLGEVLENQATADDLVQLDVVATGNEIAALPLELVEAAAGVPMLVHDATRIILTRRVRGTFAERRLPIRPVPKVLFVHSDAGGAIPAKSHERYLRQHLEPWAVRKSGGSQQVPLQVIANATLAGIRSACEEAEKEADGLPPFSHVHFLAHGVALGEEEYEKCYGIKLHDGIATPKQIVDALGPLHHRAVTVTLASCDGGNEAASIVPARSLAHELHAAGIPMVVASQLPLTVPGSERFVDAYYGAALSGHDVRQVLHDVRCALWKHKDECWHDWASIVAYMQLPEGYSEELEQVSLVRELEALKAARKSAEALLTELSRAQRPSPSEQLSLLAEFEVLVERVKRRVSNLEAMARKVDPKRRGLSEENLGLLGSAKKRLAELCFYRGGFPDGAAWLAQSRQSLALSLNYYQQAYKRNLSHHWSTVQALSLQAVMGQTLSSIALLVAVAAAEAQAGDNSERLEDRCWALGSLIELHLLSMLDGKDPEAAQHSSSSACKALIALAPDAPAYVVESTTAQLRRYVDWWTASNGFFSPRGADLSGPAQTLLGLFAAPQASA